MQVAIDEVEEKEEEGEDEDEDEDEEEETRRLFGDLESIQVLVQIH